MFLTVPFVVGRLVVENAKSFFLHAGIITSSIKF
jgi:hypothetical protein